MIEKGTGMQAGHHHPHQVEGEIGKDLGRQTDQQGQGQNQEKDMRNPQKDDRENTGDTQMALSIWKLKMWRISSER